MRQGIIRRGRSIALLAMLVALALGATAKRADAAVYWGAEDGLGAANLDGGEPQWNYFYVPAAGEMQGPACGVAVDSEYLYWAAPGGIVRRKLEGEGVYPGMVVPHLSNPCGLAMDGSHVYWGTFGHPPSSPGTGAIGRANLDGSEANTTFIGGLERPCGIAVEAGHLYWVERDYFSHAPSANSSIGRANLDGSESRPAYIPTNSTGCGVTASGGYLYWAEGGSISRATLDGSVVETGFIPDTGDVEGIAVAEGHIYWVAQNPPGSAVIGRANLDGGEIDDTWIQSGERELGGIAVDSRPSPPALTLPSRDVAVAPQVEYNLRSGAVLLGVYLPAQGPLRFPAAPQGELRVTSPGLAWSALATTGPYALHGGDYLRHVRIRSGSGRVGRRIRAQLHERGWAKVTVRLRYTAPRTFPVTASVTVALRRARGAKAGWVKHPHAG